MVELKTLGENLASVEGDQASTLVSLLEGFIFLRHYDSLLNIAYTQRFTCTVNNILDKIKMRELYPNKKVIKNAALEHTKGITNKIKFKHNLERLNRDKIITPREFHILSEFISNSHCPPIKLSEKLIVMGFSRLISELDFYEEEVFLSMSVNALDEFINLLKENTNGL